MYFAFFLIIASLIVIVKLVIKKIPELSKIKDAPRKISRVTTVSKDAIVKDRLKRSIMGWWKAVLSFGMPLVLSVRKVGMLGINKLYALKDKHEVTRKTVSGNINEHITSLFKNVDALIKKEEWAGAEVKLIEIIGLDHKNVEAFVMLGQVYFEKKNYNEAIETLEHAKKLGGGSEEVYCDLSALYQEIGDTEKAFKYSEMVLGTNPNNPRYLDMAMQLAILMRDKVSALDMYKRLEKTNPSNAKLQQFKEKIRLL